MSVKLRISLFRRIKYAFWSYNTQNFFSSFGKVCKKVFKCILLTVLVLSLIYICLHPIDKLKVKFFFTRSCTIYTTVIRHNSSVEPDKVLIDGNWLKYHGHYLKFEDGEVYKYFRDEEGEWQRTLYNSKEESGLGSEILKRSNWKLVNGKWMLKDEVAAYFKGLYNIRMGTADGHIAIIGDVYYGDSKSYQVAIVFYKFGTTEITPPVDD